MPSRPTMTRQQILTIFVCVGIFALGQFHRASGSIFTPILMDRYALPAATIGGLVSAMFLASIAAQVPFGYVLDKTGPRRVLAGCITIIALGTLLFALAVSFEEALASRVLIGIGSAAMGAATHVIIARNFDIKDFGYINGLVVMLGGIGGLLGTYPLAIALANAPWALVFGAISVLTVALALSVYLAIPKQSDPKSGEENDTGEGYFTLLRQPEILKILCLSFTTFAPIVTITGLWGGPFLRDVLGLNLADSGAVLLILNLATIMGAYVFGRLDRAAKSRRAVIVCGAAVSVVCFAALALYPTPSGMISIPLLLLMIFCQQFYIPLGAHMRRIVPDHLLARASTLLVVVAVAAIPLLQVLFGVVLDVTAAQGFSTGAQYRAAFGMLGILIAVALLIYLTAKDANDQS